jgi:hypothetical protein
VLARFAREDSRLETKETPMHAEMFHSRGRGFFTALLVFLLIASAPLLADPPTAGSDFESCAESWFWVDLEQDGPYPIIYGSGPVTWQATGGNPGGCISAVDPSGEAFFFGAPGRFLGDKSVAYGGNLAFDMMATGTGSGWDFIPEIVLVGGGMSVVANFNIVSLTPSWQSFSLPLSEPGWKYNDPDTGAPVTQADFQAVLADLQQMYICADYVPGNEITYLDNVSMPGVQVLLGDLNCDGCLNVFDIDPFVVALTDSDAYAATYPDCDRSLADINLDGVVNTFDIDPFVVLLSGGG